MLVIPLKNNNGNAVKNQYRILDHENGQEFFQSYNSIIVRKSSGGIVLDKYLWNFSRTTAKYRNFYLQETSRETLCKIDSGEYSLENLN